MEASSLDHRFTVKILFGMLVGMLVGLAFKYLPIPAYGYEYFISGVCDTLGQIFIRLIRMLVVPIVFVSLVCGASDLQNFKDFGRIGGKSLLLYLFTTALAISIALLVASALNIGHGMQTGQLSFNVKQAPGIKAVFLDMFTTNPILSLAEGNMLQIVFFSLFFGLALTVSGEPGAKVAQGFKSLNHVIIKLVLIIIKLAPYGVFCLLAVQFSKFGWEGVVKVMGYFSVVIVVLFLQLVVVYSGFLVFIARLSPFRFFKKMYSAMLFAFSVSSSSASIPIVLNTVKKKLGVDNKVASFVIPVGATINMDGTAIMQGVATVFIANVYGIHLGFSGCLTVVLMATLASVGTAAVPSVGLITLAMVLEQVGVPVQGIALIFGIDRILDMLRTAVNVCGDAMVACLVARSEKAFNQEIFAHED